MLKHSTPQHEMQPICRVVKSGTLVVMTMNTAILSNVTLCSSSPPPSEQKMGIVPASVISEPTTVHSIIAKVIDPT